MCKTDLCAYALVANDKENMMEQTLECVSKLL